MKTQHIRPQSAGYPEILVQRLRDAAPRNLYALGDCGILRNRLLGLICSIQCPGSIVIRTFDLIRKLREERTVMIGGFHSPMERDCLDLLLRGVQPAILCPAKSLRNLRMGKLARKALAESRLLVLSAFGDEVRRTTSTQAFLRNDMVSALSETLLVPYASKNGKTWSAVRRAFEYGHKVFTFEDEANADLIACGARACREDRIDDIISKTREVSGGPS